MKTEPAKITSAQNQTIKELAKLSSKKVRDEKGLFLAEGLHLLQEASDAGLLEQVFQLEDAPLFQTRTKQYTPITFCTQAVLNKLSSQKSDAKYIGVIRKPEETDLAAFLKSHQKVLLLDHLQDPGNVGTLIRSACAFGMDAVLLSADCADPYGPKAIQSSQGALFHIPVLEADLLSAIETLKQEGVHVYGAALHQDSSELHDTKIPETFGIVIGNEGQGIRPVILAACSSLIHIEMAAFESLNAAIAGSILMYAFQFPD